MSPATLRWTPGAVLVAGAVLTLGVQSQRRLPLRLPFAGTIPGEIADYRGDADVTLSPAERDVAGVSDYLLRNFRRLGGDSTRAPWISVYVGYYDQQMQGRTIHSPKNCLPGAGWEPLASRAAIIATETGPVPVNRYLLQRGNEHVLVLYWYQGRGRVAANEYLVKWNLLRDAALRHRSDEALVRVIVPVTGDDETGAFALAERAAQRIVPALYRSLPD
jgi:EpsI family protein